MNAVSKWTRFSKTLDDETLISGFLEEEHDALETLAPACKSVRFFFHLMSDSCSVLSEGRTHLALTLMVRLTLNKLNTSFPISALLQRSSNHMTMQHLHLWAEKFLRARDRLSTHHQSVTNHLLIQYHNVWPAQFYLNCDFLSELNIRSNWFSAVMALSVNEHMLI